MEYENDPLLPVLQEEIANRTSQYANLSAAEEQKLLMLTDAQKKVILESDKAAKAAYLSAQPAISNAGVKSHEKYAAYTASIGAAH